MKIEELRQINNKIINAINLSEDIAVIEELMEALKCLRQSNQWQKKIIRGCLKLANTST